MRDPEHGAFWGEFRRALRGRGLSGVRLVISDAHSGLREAIGTTMLGAAWRRCLVHFMRNVLPKVPKAASEMVATTIRTIFAQPNGAMVRAQLEQVAERLELGFPRDPTVPGLRSTDPLERLNKEIPVIDCAGRYAIAAGPGLELAGRA